MTSPPSPADPDWSAITQAAAALVALVVGLGLGALQFLTWRADRRRQTAAYLLGALAAAVQAERTLTHLGQTIGGRPAAKIEIELMSCVPLLNAAASALEGLPLYQAPSLEVANCILQALEQVRLSRDALESAGRVVPTHGVNMDFAPGVALVADAVTRLKAEQRRLGV